MQIKDISERDFSSAVSSRAIVEFYSDTCAYCKMLSPLLEQTSKDSEVGFFKVNVSSENELARKFGVRSVPTLIAFANGREVERKIGVIGKGELSEMLDSTEAISV